MVRDEPDESVPEQQPRATWPLRPRRYPRCILGSETSVAANLPEPPPERGGLILGLGLLVIGGCVLALALLGGSGGQNGASNGAQPPRIVAATPTPTLTASSAPAATRAPAATGRPAIVAARPGNEQQRDLAAFDRRAPIHVPASWVAGFYPVYAVASKTFAVNWLLVASIHEQETAFSTAPGTYHGLNFAHCCGGPMQFNVTNGPVTTWALVRNSYIYASRPAGYPHPTVDHPSIYDDFDAMMAASRLLELDGATEALDYGAWVAAYDYYGNDETGVTYADQVLARAIGWSQHGFCINCGLDPSLVAAVQAAYGAPVLAALQAAAARQAASGATGATGATGPTGTTGQAGPHK
jgi:hypothetical protein